MIQLLDKKSLFTLLLLTVAVSATILTLQLGAASRMIPLFVLIPTLMLVGVQFAIDIRNLKKSQIEDAGFDNTGKVLLSTESVNRNLSPACVHGSERRAIAWLLLLPLLIYLFGLVGGSILYLFWFLKVISTEKNLYAFWFSAMAGVILLLLAVSLRQTQLMDSAFWMWLTS